MRTAQGSRGEGAGGSMRFGGVCAGNVLDIGPQPRVTMSARAPERQSARAHRYGEGQRGRRALLTVSATAI